jgi:drug/metabolite transporter (DMT)-like permease
VTDVVEPIPGVAASPVRRPARGYLLYLGAAVLFALNGTVAKSLLLAGIEATRLSQLRATFAFLILLGVVAATNRHALRLRRAELPLLLVYGVLGIALTQFLYYLSIERLPIGIALLIEFTAPLVIAIWFRFGLRQPTRPIVWVALVAAIGGLAIVAEAWEGFTLDPLGVAYAIGAMLALVVYFVTADAQVRRPEPRDPVSLTMWGMGAAALAWAVAAPWWSFPFDVFGGTLQLIGNAGPVVPAAALAGWMVVLGTVVPFSLVVLSMQHLRASQASTVGLTEPIIATGIAWVALGEALSPIQIAGAVVVLASVFVAERNR